MSFNDMKIPLLKNALGRLGVFFTVMLIYGLSPEYLLQVFAAALIGMCVVDLGFASLIVNTEKEIKVKE